MESQEEKEAFAAGLATAKRRHPDYFAEGAPGNQQEVYAQKRAATTDPHELGKLDALRRHGRVNG